MMLTFYGFGPRWGIGDPSPFCLKLENYLKIANVDYQAAPFSPMVLQKAPKGKLPFVQHMNGQIMGDSNHIIDHLIAQGAYDPDAVLNAEQKAISLAFRRLLDESLYWVLLHSRWEDPVGWAVIKDVFFGDVPFFVRGIVQKSQQKKFLNNTRAHGMGRHTSDEIYTSGESDLAALSDFLADKTYILDTEKPTLLDLTLQAYTINVLKSPINNRLKSFIQSRPNLVRHCEQIETDVAQQKSM